MRNAMVSILIPITAIAVGTFQGCSDPSSEQQQALDQVALYADAEQTALNEWDNLVQEDKDLACSVYRGAPNDTEMLNLLLEGGNMSPRVAQAKINLLSEVCPSW